MHVHRRPREAEAKHVIPGWYTVPTRELRMQRMRGMGCLVALVVAACAEQPPSLEQGRIVFEDSFDEFLDSDWIWVHSAPEGWRIEQGSLFLLTEPGGFFQEEDDGKNILVRALPQSPEPLLVEVGITLHPEGKYENAGIILYVDDDNYVVVNKESYANEEPSLRLQVVYELNGEARIPHDTAYDPAHVILGMRIAESKVTGLYRSSTSEPWTVLGSVPYPGGGVPRIGVKTTYGVSGAERWAEFDNFRVSTVP
jgi:hypothetical protein